MTNLFARLSSFFDIKGDLRSLLGSESSSSKEIRCLHGIRGLISIWMILFHAFFFIAMFMNEQQLAQIDRHAWFMKYVIVGLSNVDVFFILTGFLIALPLLTMSTEELSKLSLRTVYWRRFIQRIYPPYIAALVLWCFILFPHGLHPVKILRSPIMKDIMAEYYPHVVNMPTNCSITPINLLFLNNFLPFGGCMGPSWSLAVQGQFYFLFPLLIKFVGNRRGVVVLSIVGILINVASRFATAIVYADYMNSPQMFPFTKQQFDRFYVNFVHYYSPTLQRMGALWLGVLLACVQRDIDARAAWTINWKNRYQQMCQSLPVIFRLDFVLGIVTFYILDLRVYYVPGILFNAFISVGGSVWCFFVCFLLFLMINRVGILGAFLDDIFSSKLWYPFSALSYCTYLVHFQVQTQLAATAYYPPDPLTWEVIIPYTIASYVGTYAISLIMYIFVERPFARLFNRSVEKVNSKVAVGQTKKEL